LCNAANKAIREGDQASINRAMMALQTGGYFYIPDAYDIASYVSLRHENVDSDINAEDLKVKI